MATLRIKQNRKGGKETWARQIHEVIVEQAGIAAFPGKYIKTGVEWKATKETYYLVVEPRGAARILWVDGQDNIIESAKQYNYYTEQCSLIEYAHDFIEGLVD